MLRSAGYFRRFLCPFGCRWCRRPHCQYRHESRRPEEPSLAWPRHQPLSGSPSLGLGKNIQEVERIDKTIQSVKTEIEEGKKHCYNFEQDDFKNSLAPVINDSEGNILSTVKGHPCSIPPKDKVCAISTSKESCKSSNYILDLSCPATDLEYDPLLNYSASLLRPTVKSPCENRFPKKRPRSSSPVRLQESDDNMLVIEAPPMSMSKKRKLSGSCKKWNKGENDVSFECNAETLKSSEKSKSLYCIKEKRPEDITIALDYNKNDEKEIRITSATHGNSFFPNVNEETNPDAQRKHHLMGERNMLSHSRMMNEVNKETLKQDSVKIQISDMKEQRNNWKTLLNKTQTKTCSKDNSKDGVVQEIFKKSPEHLVKFQSMQLYEKYKVLNDAQSGPVVLDENISFFEGFLLESPDKMPDNKSVSTCIKENEVIVLDSSGEDDSEEGRELSDDTMEECRNFFNEFVECEARKEEMAKQAFVAQKANSDSKTSVLPGQKRRIAHTAKFDVNTAKEIIVPLKAPLPQQVYHSRILQAQQQAVQIKAAVKSGQAFVAATCASKKRVSVIPAIPVQNMGPTVGLNVFEIQPVAANSGHLNVLLQRGALTTMPCRLSSDSVRRIAPTPIKVSSQKRPSVVPELRSKVPHDIRQRYINFFVEEFLKVCTTVNEAFDKALAEEKAIYDRCGSKNMYLNIAVNTLKKLRDHGSASSDGQTFGNRSPTSTDFRKQEEKNDFTGISLYRLLKDYALTEKQLKENGYPEPNPEKPGRAMLGCGIVKPVVCDPSRRICCRCGKTYSISSSGKHIRKEECNYHSGRILRHKVPGGLETCYSCCEGVVGSSGCQVAKLHVHDGRKENIDGFVKTFIKPPPLDGNHGVFAVDCEMCYTTHGLELSRVTVVDPSLQVVYDTFVKPDNEIIDYNSRFSGVTAEDMENTATSVRDVQAILLNLFSADTVLIGHGLESDLFALKLFHNIVVDTSVVFPHRLGWPHKKALRNLIADYLRRIIQDNVSGHDSSEDATACMELMLWKVREDSKSRR